MSESSDEMKKIGRNDPCHCGSGKKYKKCHLVADEEAGQAEDKKREAAAKASKEDEKEEDDSGGGIARPTDRGKPQKPQNQNTQRFQIPRRSNG